jgi:acyl-coenzyme A thioesterase PaaI-like protein
MVFELQKKVTEMESKMGSPATHASTNASTNSGSMHAGVSSTFANAAGANAAKPFPTVEAPPPLSSLLKR